MGKTDLDNHEYDNYLASNKKYKEIRERTQEKKKLSKNFSGWHFGIDTVPVKTRDKDEFKRALDERGLMMRDDVKKDLR